MTQWQNKSRKKPSGGLLRKHCKNKRSKRGRDFLPAHIAGLKKRTVGVFGGHTKTSIMSANIANIIIDGKSQKTEITNVL